MSLRTSDSMESGGIAAAWMSVSSWSIDGLSLTYKYKTLEVTIPTPLSDELNHSISEPVASLSEDLTDLAHAQALG
jgi:hypothetical protein